MKEQIECSNGDRAVRRVGERQGLFQVLPVHGQNHERFAEFEIDHARFEAFVERHGELAAHGIDIVGEANEDTRRRRRRRRCRRRPAERPPLTAR